MLNDFLLPEVESLFFIFFIWNATTCRQTQTLMQDITNIVNYLGTDYFQINFFFFFLSIYSKTARLVLSWVAVKELHVVEWRFQKRLVLEKKKKKKKKTLKINTTMHLILV